VVSNLAMQAAAFPNFIQVSHDQGIRPDLLAPVQELMNEAVADGHGAGDISALVEVLRKPAPAA
jgi:3-hydroxyisobutyrate dehydrogenase-like beta-hydroxyacid dehydrogenase